MRFYSATAVLAILCGTAAGAAVPETAAVELLRPAPGEVLAAGSDALVEWQAHGPLAPGVEEWEAFLSVSGGGYYALRLTPHLDVARRRFAFRVPTLPTDDARILLRFGDEEREMVFESRHRFSIRPSASAVPLRGRLALPGRGESARPGEPGVVAWLEGTREGDRLALFETPPLTGARPAVSQGSGERNAAFSRRTAAPVSLAGDRRPRALRRPPDRRAEDRPLSPSSILLLDCRRNE